MEVLSCSANNTLPNAVTALFTAAGYPGQGTNPACTQVSLPGDG
jgi:hypothetical protein